MTGFGVVIRIDQRSVRFASATRGHLTTLPAEITAALIGLDVLETVLKAGVDLFDRSRIYSACLYTDSKLIFDTMQHHSATGVLKSFKIPKHTRMMRKLIATKTRLTLGNVVKGLDVRLLTTHNNPAHEAAELGVRVWKDRW